MLKEGVENFGHFPKQNERRMTEDDKNNYEYEKILASKEVVSAEDVLKLKTATIGYLCSPNRNSYDIRFLSFSLRDVDSNNIIFEVQKPPSEYSQKDLEQHRCIRYQFNKEFLLLKTVGATVEFSNGSKHLSEFRMIERHYFKDKLLKSFDFNFGFVMPNSVNTVEHIYEFPKLTDNDVKDMVENPFETRSDSFYFVNGALIMHNKAEYAFNG
uniref:GMP phosphodiesterase delta subunit domain-containing protein n=1 Tax=Trichobilharzia regenti TaxID=157069 RepID=A0AA85ISY9_TRIRE|nr:unnamed protein product [Trichobilharzia regenti]